MPRLLRPLGLIATERRLVDQQVGTARRLHHEKRGTSVAGVDQGPPGARLTHQIGRFHGPAVLERDALALVELSPEWPFRNPELERPFGIEPPQPDVLGESVPDGVRAMLRLEHHDVVVAAGDPVAGAELEDLDGKLVPLDPQIHGQVENARGTLGAIEPDRRRPILKSHGAKQAGDAEHVIGVIVGEEDLGEGEPDAVPHHLALRPLAAVEENHFPLSPHRERRDVPIDRRGGRTGTQEGDA